MEKLAVSNQRSAFSFQFSFTGFTESQYCGVIIPLSNLNNTKSKNKKAHINLMTSCRTRSDVA